MLQITLTSCIPPNTPSIMHSQQYPQINIVSQLNSPLFPRSMSCVPPTIPSSFSQINVMRPPNYTLLMIWIPVIVLASIIGYLKRENLHMLYNSRYWAIAAMVSGPKGRPILSQLHVLVHLHYLRFSHLVS